jgi:hypothetical protein
MAEVSHLSMWYDTRSTVHIDTTSPSNNPNTELKETPEVARIEYDDGTVKSVDSLVYFSPGEVDGYKVAQFLIGRAMFDPGATVISQD